MNNVRLSEMSKKQTKTNRGQHSVVLHDDNVNTFDHVMNCLIDVCGHNQFQAEQCALIVHSTKRCVVFTDSYADCELVYEYLYKLGLKVTLEKFKK
jgi:ATP-dependent Clp protease adaptor protein ClpS